MKASCKAASPLAAGDGLGTLVFTLGLPHPVGRDHLTTPNLCLITLYKFIMLFPKFVGDGVLDVPDGHIYLFGICRQLCRISGFATNFLWHMWLGLGTVKTVPYRALYYVQFPFRVHPTRRGAHCAPATVRGMTWQYIRQGPSSGTMQASSPTNHFSVCGKNFTFLCGRIIFAPTTHFSFHHTKNAHSVWFIQHCARFANS